MKLIKHLHACTELVHDGHSVVIDPGAFTPNAAELVARAAAVLITHEHYDHVDADALDAALSARKDLTVHGPQSAVGKLKEAHPGQVHTVREGDSFTAGGLEVTVHGERHAMIHHDIPQVTNVGYLIGGLYHPGDAYHVPDGTVSTLLLPTSGPWSHLSEAVDYIRAVRPDTLVQIHEIHLSEAGQQSMAMFLSPKMLSQVPLTILPPGESMNV